MPERRLSLSNYRFGFNTQEKVDEISGLGNHNTALFWEYDTRLGRRWNLDPVIKPWISHYSTLSGNPILNIDPLGNTDYYSKGKWIGNDGNENGLMAVVNSKAVKKEIKHSTRLGLNCPDYNLRNGESNSKIHVIHSDILSASVEVMKKALTTSDEITEHKAVLKENDKGGFDKIYEGSDGKLITDSEGNKRVSGGETPDGDIRIHSHAIGNSLKDEVGSVNDALDPTKCDPLAGGDLCKDPEYDLNIIVGRNGKLAPTSDAQGRFSMKENRPLSINIFGPNSILKFTLSYKDVWKMFNEKNKRKKENFLNKQKN